MNYDQRITELATTVRALQWANRKHLKRIEELEKNIYTIVSESTRPLSQRVTRLEEMYFKLLDHHVAECHADPPKPVMVVSPVHHRKERCTSEQDHEYKGGKEGHCIRCGKPRWQSTEEWDPHDVCYGPLMPMSGADGPSTAEG